MDGEALKLMAAETNCPKFRFHVKAYILIVVTNSISQLFSLKQKAQLFARSLRVNFQFRCQSVN